MQEILIFDVDGTLTGPRRVMHDDFARFFRAVIHTKPVFLVTGSDMPKLEEQIPDCLLKDVAGAFTCSGNEFWRNGRALFTMNHAFPEEITDHLQALIDESEYEIRTGNHIESRAGTLNVSVVGRNATPSERAHYCEYDQQCGERNDMMAKIMSAFSDYEANCGGQISIDISPRGWNKSRVFNELSSRFPNASFRFFGDNIHPGGNDYPLAKAVEGGGQWNVVHRVADHYETWKILQNLLVEFAEDRIFAAG